MIVPARPPFDPELAEALAHVTDRTEDVDQLLAQAGVVRRDVVVAGYQGAQLVASVLAREDPTGAGPGVYHLHGGGMVMGGRTAGATQFVPWILRHDAVVVAIEYRLAPEFPDPYPVEDCYAGLVWTSAHAAELGIDPERLIVAGASAGGGLAAGTALLARDRGGPKLIGQLLLYPMLDDRDRTVSTRQYDDHGLWTRAANRDAWNALLGERRGTDDVSVYAAPARATDLAGLPPAFIDCGSAEVFRDEDVAYATALWHAGVQAELHVWPGGFHGFDIVAPHAAVSRSMVDARDAWIARLVSAGSPTAGEGA